MASAKLPLSAHELTESLRQARPFDASRLDRVLRIALGIVILSLAFILEGNARYWGLVGLLPLVTGLFQYCPAYSIFGLSTCPMERKGA